MRCTVLSVIAVSAAQAAAQQSFQLANWQGTFAADSGVLESLKPASDTSFDFSPSDFFSQRNGVGNYHTGDITLRWRQSGQDGGWTTLDTAQLRDAKPANSQPEGSLLHSDFSGVSPDLAGKLSVTRDWLQVGSDLVLSVNVSVPSDAAEVELGSFGFPVEFNSIFSNRTADEVTAKCSLIDPYIGQGAGYVQVTRLNGKGPNLVVTPHGAESKFEGWRFLSEPNASPFYYQSQTFEGFYSWEVYTKAWAENEWNATQPWNAPTSVTLEPGHSIQLGLRFTPAQNVYDIESAVSSVGRPVVVGLPGYVLPRETEGKVFLKHEAAVSSITADPADALQFEPASVPNTAWKAYTVTAGDNAFGRVRVTVKYADGLEQTVHYFVTQSQSATASSFADFHFTNSYINDTSDPFGRYGLITFDSIANAQVTQDQRVWIAGLADDAGSIYEGLSLKESALPDRAHILQLETMVEKAIWGQLQNSDYSVKRSLFFYEPSALPNYTYSTQIGWSGAWNKTDAYSTWRAYDYVHVSSIYYSLYRAERVEPGILTMQSASWYLEQAFQTVVASQRDTAYADVGLMGETMWVWLLNDLKNEGLSSQAQQVEAIMKKRQQNWASQSDPFGSEMAWDSTGEEGVYAWSRYFNDQATTTKTVEYIRGYMPTVAHWGWNGNARRYWDFLYGGKEARIERMIHHYGSSLNALPLLDHYMYEQDPASAAAFYDLRVGYGGIMGPLSNINAAGMTSTAFHSFPDTLQWDGYSGDYGPTYNGHILGSCTYLVEHPDFGWVAMGGDVDTASSSVTVTPTDTVRRRIYVATLGLSVQVDAGEIASFSFSPSSQKVEIKLAKSAAATAASSTILTFQSTLGKDVKLENQGLEQKLGGYVVPLPETVTFGL